ncbi:dipeptidyl peptidase III [Aspergillus sclerotioniger CBS 115572]|uniref:Dipeptidyl peptidase III n=1 Tax=Aspergillus sclerotioniger CBS 115572 TaxID=1450535 RepID=A0A317WL63_9EURO|nr:dipeptidyl peptidase III [Aspergillus sclerotioniger CBS 115572]PWY87059.1 dipeptidyl peptidase III [Aspergillus sclerotioniger CBS 115572]
MDSSALSCGQVTTYQFSIKDVFDGLTDKEKLYAHHLSQAAWAGSRIIMRQTSPEGTGIFDFIMELHKACQGEWTKLSQQFEVSVEEVNSFLDYAGTFPSKLNNFCGERDRKIVPRVSADSLRIMASISPATTEALEKVIEPMLSTTPATLGLSNPAYYPGAAERTKDEIAAVARVMERHGLKPEKTRIRKSVDGDHVVYSILQASLIKESDQEKRFGGSGPFFDILQQGGGDQPLGDATVRFVRGTLEGYRRAMKHWLEDYSPRVESIFGFIEPYRDPYGVRCEWRGVVGISDSQQTAKLTELVENSAKLMRTLPWAVAEVNDGKGPFEKDVFKTPSFSIVHALAFLCSNVWEASSLPNYNDIRETNGFKNIVYANRMSANADPNRPFHWVHPTEAQRFKRVNHIIRFITTSIHELLGHRTGKLLAESSPGVYNFDPACPPVNTLTGRPVESWYRPGQTWTSVFEKLAGSVEECRAMLISYYLDVEKDMLSMFGYDDHSGIRAEDFIYNLYLHVGVVGLCALQAFDVKKQAWGSPHANAEYAIFTHLLRDADGLMWIECDRATGTLHVRVDRSRISHGKASIGRMLHKIHVWRCTADVAPCKALYEPLSTVDGMSEVWREIVVSKPDAPWKFVQANTVLYDGKVNLRTYEASNEGIIQSFADRCV